MSAIATPSAAPNEPHTGLWPLETNRGVYAVTAAIVTEAALFVCLFASYYFLGNNKDRWAIDTPPKLTLALIMLSVLVASSFVVMWGERMVKQRRYGLARIAVFVTILMGAGFLAIQAAEYHDHWKTLTPSPILTDPFSTPS
jgi:heme/copper-type cytochrome/quinol oxidase subunit 3